jgi:hypothetical protein
MLDWVLGFGFEKVFAFRVPDSGKFQWIFEVFPYPPPFHLLPESIMG